MEKKFKLNQCQDCGCMGARLIIEIIDDGMFRVKCPCCSRRGSVVVTSRGITTSEYHKLLEESWNPYNRENKEGLD